MRRRLSLIMTLAAWLLATGSHWDLVQTFAWGKMIATYSQTMTLSEAVRLTFTPENMCDVCAVVSEAKQAEQHAATVIGGKLDGKVLLVFQPAPAFVLIAAPEVSKWSLSDPQPRSADPAAPPVPPPRAVV